MTHHNLEPGNWTHFYVRLHEGRSREAMRSLASLHVSELSWIAQEIAAELERRKMLRGVSKMKHEIVRN